MMQSRPDGKGKNHYNNVIIPFLVLRSYSLKETRYKMFTDRYLLTFNAFNVLNMLLSKEE
jgi:hypothetical protein